MIHHGLCNSYRAEILAGVHQPGDVYMLALFLAEAALDENTTVYSPVNESSGIGYTAGGQALAGFAIALDGNVAIADFTVDPEWPASTLRARGGLVYNASKGNKAVGVMDFGADMVTTNGPFTVRMPPPSAATALIRVR